MQNMKKLVGMAGAKLNKIRFERERNRQDAAAKTRQPSEKTKKARTD